VTSLWRALAVAWLGGIGSPALRDDAFAETRSPTEFVRFERESARPDDPAGSASVPSEIAEWIEVPQERARASVGDD
jgi:hypothetical protein